MLSFWNLHRLPIVMVLISIIFYSGFAYDLERNDFIKLITLFAGLFFFAFKLIQLEKWNFKFLFLAGLLFRLTFLFALPNLSQDFYRFIWDGELILSGINPYLFVPNSLIKNQEFLIPFASELHEGMGELSAKHFSNYPPLSQVLFAISVFLSGKSILGSIIVMRVMIILADVGILYFGKKLLKNLNLSPHLIFWYFLNPLILIELTGNLHFEGVMLFFFVWALYLLSINNWKWAAVLYSLSIGVKLIPLLFLPLFLNYFGFKKSIGFYLIVSVSCFLLLLPFYSPDFISNYSATIGLWFSNFEFNAGLYNLIKQIALYFDVKGYVLIRSFGKFSPYLIIFMVLLFTFLRDNRKLSGVLGSMFWVLTCYYFLSTTVHPWYITFLVLLSIFTKYRFALLWSGVVFISYWAYSQNDFKENLGILLIEYITVLGLMAYELIKRNNKKLLFCKNWVSHPKHSI